MMHMTDSATGEYLYTEEYCIDDIIAGEEKLEKLFGTKIDGLAWPLYASNHTQKRVQIRKRALFICARFR